MFKVFRLLCLGLFLTLISCATENPEKEKRPLVYEGMSVGELEEVLGRPLEIDSSGVVTDVEAGKKKKVERWRYEKRTVILIDDTVTNPNLPSRQVN